MSKADYIRKLRGSPIGADGIDRIRKIAAGDGADKINEVFIDMFTARHIVAIIDNLSESTVAKMANLTVNKLAKICFSAKA